MCGPMSPRAARDRFVDVVEIDFAIVGQRVLERDLVAFGERVEQHVAVLIEADEAPALNDAAMLEDDLLPVALGAGEPACAEQGDLDERIRRAADRLSEWVREHALESFGPLAAHVWRSWGVKSSCTSQRMFHPMTTLPVAGISAGSASGER